MSTFSELEPREMVFTDEYWGTPLPGEPYEVSKGRILDLSITQQTAADTVLAVLTGTNEPRRLVTGTRLAMDVGENAPDYLQPGAVWLTDYEHIRPHSPMDGTAAFPTSRTPEDQNRRVAETGLVKLLLEDAIALSEKQELSEVDSVHSSLTTIYREERVYFRTIAFMIVTRRSKGLSLANVIQTSFYGTKPASKIVALGAIPLPRIIGDTREEGFFGRGPRFSRIRSVQVCRPGHPVKEKSNLFSRLFSFAAQPN